MASLWTPSAPVLYTGVSNLVIAGLGFNGVGTGSQITLSGCTNVTIQDCGFLNAIAGVRANGCTNVTVQRCYATDIGRRGGGTSANFVQFQQTNGTIIDNVVENGPLAAPEDIISIYGANPGATLIAGNRLLGGGPSLSGSGINVGDGDATNGHASNVTVASNVLIDTGQLGIGVSGGSTHTVQDNIVVGTQRINSNVGISAWNQGGPATTGVTVQRNAVRWFNKNGVLNGLYDGGNVGVIAGWATNDSTAAYLATLKYQLLGLS